MHRWIINSDTQGPKQNPQQQGYTGPEHGYDAWHYAWQLKSFPQLSQVLFKSPQFYLPQMRRSNALKNCQTSAVE